MALARFVVFRVVPRRAAFFFAAFLAGFRFVGRFVFVFRLRGFFFAALLAAFRFAGRLAFVFRLTAFFFTAFFGALRFVTRLRVGCPAALRGDALRAGAFDARLGRGVLLGVDAGVSDQIGV